jgi:hypothetical protein
VFEKPRKLMALWLSLLILFPQIEKGIHGYQHQNQVFYQTTQSQLHTLQSLCSVCDFLSEITFIPIVTPPDFKTFEFLTVTSPQIKNFPVLNNEYYIPFRAPPVVA